MLNATTCEVVKLLAFDVSKPDNWVVVSDCVCDVVRMDRFVPLNAENCVAVKETAWVVVKETNCDVVSASTLAKA